MAQRLVEADGTKLTGTVILGECAEQVSPVKKSSPRPDLMSREKAIKHASQAQRFLLPVNDTSRKPKKKKKSYAPCLLFYCFISILLLCNQETALFGGKVLMWFNVENNLKKKKKYSAKTDAH